MRRGRVPIETPDALKGRAGRPLAPLPCARGGPYARSHFKARAGGWGNGEGATGLGLEMASTYGRLGRARRGACVASWGWLVGHTAARARLSSVRLDSFCAILERHGPIPPCPVCSFRVPTIEEAAHAQPSPVHSKLSAAGGLAFLAFVRCSARWRDGKRRRLRLLSHSQASPAQEGYRALRDRGSLMSRRAG